MSQLKFQNQTWEVVSDLRIFESTYEEYLQNQTTLAQMCRVKVDELKYPIQVKHMQNTEDIDLLKTSSVIEIAKIMTKFNPFFGILASFIEHYGLVSEL